MKNRLLFGLLGCIAIGGVTSCHEQKEVVEKPTPIQLEVEEKLAGKWEVATVDEIPVLTNEKSVVTYEDGWKSFRSLSDKRMTAGWLVNSTFKCSIYGNQITEISKDNGGDSIKFVTQVGEISYTEINATIRRSYNHGSEDSHRYVLRKIKDDFSADIIGLWEGKSALPGFPDSSVHRWEYRPDGTFLYYDRDTVADAWVLNKDRVSVYNVDGKWLAMRRETADSLEIRECWDLSVEDDKMYWSALREDNYGRKYDDKQQLFRVVEP